MTTDERIALAAQIAAGFMHGNLEAFLGVSPDCGPWTIPFARCAADAASEAVLRIERNLQPPSSAGQRKDSAQ